MKRLLPWLCCFACSGSPTPPDDLASADMAEPAPELDLAPRPDQTPPGDLATSAATTTTGFDVPESAYFHAPSNAWYVSNLALTDLTKLAVKDQKGWISKLDRQGKVLEARWFEGGLSSPAGIRGTEKADQIVVANIDELVFINTTTKAADRASTPGAGLLNDVDVGPDGTVYATDTFGNAIWSYKKGAAAQRLITDAQLNFPNGVLVAGGRLLIASTGPFDKADPGVLWSFNLVTKSLVNLGYQGKSDGIEADSGGLLISDNPTARVFFVQSGQAPRLVRDFNKEDGLKTAGDIGFDAEGRVLAVPDLQGNSVTFVKLP